MSSGHSHTNNRKKNKLDWLASLLLIPIVGLLFYSPNIGSLQSSESETLEGVVLSVENRLETQMAGEEYFLQVVKVKITRGQMEGETIEVINDTVASANVVLYQAGDEILLVKSTNFEGQEIFYITDFIRYDGIVALFVIFAILSVIVGGIWGASSLVGMAFSFLIIFKFVLPEILNGNNAIVVSIIGAIMIIPVTFGLSHGWKKKTLIAAISTIISLIITGLVAAFAVNMLHLSGFGSEESVFLRVQLGESVSMQGLLLAGIIISSLGVLDDITISQASVVAELKQANKKYGFKDLYSRAMNVGRDHIASLINTLVLVYTGASLPLMLLFVNSSLSFSGAINIEMIAEEIVRTLVGSIGLILAVPITTFLSAYYYQNLGHK